MSTRQSGSNSIAALQFAVRLPGGITTPDGLWSLLKSGGDATSQIPADRWAPLQHAIGEWRRGSLATTRGGFVSDVAQFDANFFGISPREAVKLDPQHRFILETAWEALERSGVDFDSIEGPRTGVFMGISQNDYAQLHLNSAPFERLDGHDSSGNPLGFLAGRLAYFLGARGPCIAVDTACSSSLAALHLAVRSLRSNECDLAVVGGVNLILSPEIFVCLSTMGVLSRHGRCRPFEARADGFARGEGCVVLILARQEIALERSYSISGLVRGSAMNHDGRSSGLTVPNPKAQCEVIRSALTDSGVDPHDIAYIEAHGTGTPLGDPIELKALGATLGAGRSAPLVVGAVKANLGHTEAAAGLTGLVKVLLALRYEEIPAQPDFGEPTPHVSFEQLRIVVPERRVSWAKQERSRLAGVSAFGMTGTNVHVIVEEWRDSTASREPAGRELESPGILTISAKTAWSLERARSRFVEHLEADVGASVSDLCFSANTGRRHFPHRLSVVGTSRRELASALLGAKPRTAVADEQVVFQFTGQGAQYPGMCRALYEQEKVFRTTVERCAVAIHPALGYDLCDILYGDNHAGRISETNLAQPCLYAIECALADLLRSFGIRPAAVGGHSVGELAAAYVAGVFSLEDGAKIAVERGRLMGLMPEVGGMLSIAGTPEWVEDNLLTTGVVIAAMNGGRQTVVSGADEPIARASEVCRQAGVGHVRLAVSHAFHSPLMRPARDALVKFLEPLSFGVPNVPFLSSVSGGAVRRLDATYWGDQLVSPVCFTKYLENLPKLQIGTLLEIGPKAVLTSIARQELPSTVDCISSVKGPDPVREVLEAVAKLWSRGVPVDWRGVWGGKVARRVDIPIYQFERKHYWVPRVSSPRESLRPLPLFGYRIELPGSGDFRFVKPISSPSGDLFSDHRLWGDIVVPGAYFVAAVAEVVEHIFSTRAFELSDLSFLAALRLRSEERTELHLVFSPASTGFTFSAVTRREGKDIVHARGLVRPVMPSEVRGRTASDEKQGLSTTATASADIYACFDAAGYGIGPSFRWLLSVETGAGNSIGTLRAAEERETLACPICHPGFIDSCFQAATAAVMSRLQPNEGDLFVPLYIERITFFGRTCNAGAVCSTLVSSSSHAGFQATLAVRGMQGEPLLTFENVDIRRAREGSFGGSKENLPLKRLVWTPSLTQSRSSKKEVEWVLFERPPAKAETLLASLVALGHSVQVRSTPSVPPLKASSGRVRIALMLDLEPAGDSFARCEMLHAKLHESARMMREDYEQVVVLSSGSVAIRDDDSNENSWGALLEGLVKVWNKENPDRPCRFVGTADLDGVTRYPDILAAELEQAGESIVAYRKGSRFVPRLQLMASSPLAMSLRPDRTYVVTGGLGALGQHVGAWLLRGGAGRVVLLSRNADRERLSADVVALDPDERRLAVVACDVSSWDEVRASFQHLQEFGFPLGGIVHAAGELSDGAIERQGWEDFRRGLEAKVLGAVHLERALGETCLDFFVCFSSVVAAYGGAGQGAYTSANCFLDAFARRRAHLGQRTVSVQWGPWSGGGMARQLPVAKSHLYQMITPQDALRLLEQAIMSSESVVLAAPDGIESALDPVSALSEPVHGAAISLEALVARALGAGLEDVRNAQNLLALGLDSLIALELRRELRLRFNTTVDLSEVLASQTLGDLQSLIESKRSAQSGEQSKLVQPTPGAMFSASEQLTAVDSYSEKELDELIAKLQARGGI